MPRKPLTSYLRTYRLKTAMTQAELGSLLGLSGDAISLFELGKRPVSARLLVASEIVFGVSAAELFPALYDAVEEKLGANALALHDRLADRQDPASKRKRALIGGIPSRVRSTDEI